MFTQKFSVYYSPLTCLKNKSQGVITAIKNQDERIISKLLSMGLSTGMPITLEERFPSFIIRSGQTRIALDEEIASSIKVRINT